MMVSLYDTQSKSSRAAGAGATALSDGDTDLARVKYGEAGTILYNAARSARRAGDRHELLLLAASQYWHGGDYRRAAKVIRRIDRGFLSPRDQVILDKFHKDLAPRIAAGYALGIRMTVHNHRQAGRFEEGIDLLKEHSYVYDRTALAYIRFDLCLRAGDIEAAVYFSADANRFSNYHANSVFGRAASIGILKSHGKLRDANEFMHHVLQTEPTALDYAAVAVDMFEKFHHGEHDLGVKLLEYIDHAQREFSKLPSATIADTDVAFLISYAYLAGAITADRLLGRQRAMQYVEAGEQFSPSGNLSSVFEKLRSVSGTEMYAQSEILSYQSEMNIRFGNRQQPDERAVLAVATTAA